MAIVEVGEMSGGSGGFSTSNAGVYTRLFRCISNYAGDSPGTAIAAVGLRLGDPYITITASDPNAFVTDITAQQGGTEDPLGWVVTVNYSWYSANEVGGGPEQNPLLMPIDVSWGFKEYDHPVEMDIDGDPVRNSARDPYDPPLIIQVPNQLMTVVRNEAYYNTGIANLYRNSINQDSFAGSSAHFVKCFGITPKNVFDPNVGWYYQVTYEFEMMNQRNSADGLGFVKNILDRGLRKLDFNTGKQIHITLNGQPITQPMLLDGSGGLLPASGTPVYLPFQVFPELPFSEFNFDVAAINGLRTGFP